MSKTPFQGRPGRLAEEIAEENAEEIAEEFCGTVLLKTFAEEFRGRVLRKLLMQVLTLDCHDVMSSSSGIHRFVVDVVVANRF